MAGLGQFKACPWSPSVTATDGWKFSFIQIQLVPCPPLGQTDNSSGVGSLFPFFEPFVTCVQSPWDIIGRIRAGPKTL